MAIQIQGNGGVVMEVDGTTFRAIRVTARPINYGALGMYRVGAVSGTMAAALAIGAEMFQFRWPDATNLALLYKLSISAGANLAATAAALGSLVYTKATAWTVAGSGGTRIALTTPNAKLRTSMGAPLVNDMGISTTAGLTAGTKVLNTTNGGAVAFGIGTGAITTALNLSFVPPDSKLFDADEEGMHPDVFVQNEGFVIRNGAVIFPATMTWVFSVNCVWAEAAAF